MWPSGTRPASPAGVAARRRGWLAPAALAFGVPGRRRPRAMRNRPLWRRCRPAIRVGRAEIFDLPWPDPDHFPVVMSSRGGYFRGGSEMATFLLRTDGPML